MHLLQINLHHCKEACLALLERLAEDQPDVVLIQEPWVRNGEICGLRTSGYKVYKTNGEGTKRACIMAKAHLNIFMIQNFSNADTTTVSWEVSGSNIWLTSFYFAGDDTGPLPSPLIRSLVEDCKAHNRKLALGGDANAHHTVWGSSDTNERAINSKQPLRNVALKIRSKSANPG
ncbi:uncharacterized protein LOC129241665 isoform X3 [Anastrepha obliqua]|uniref:uncharacterized protein LOC129241665 isoform X3 n=1 Tax=Anastrepha obliqua TaxID=95512 RepID=UPI002409E754|nr:uncharacterized protein LOC129241665 isoform X3 [Anastrepha obliqua]